VLCRILPGWMLFQVTDEGRGFDPSAVVSPLREENLLRESGRGIFLMRTLMDKVEIEPSRKGTEVRLWLETAKSLPDRTPQLEEKIAFSEAWMKRLEETDPWTAEMRRSVREFFEQERPSIVIDAAAKVGGILANNEQPVEFLLQNLTIQNNLIEAAADTGADMVVSAIVGGAGLVPTMAAALYAGLGSPGLPDQPLAYRQAPPDPSQPDVQQMVATSSADTCNVATCAASAARDSVVSGAGTKGRLPAGASGPRHRTFSGRPSPSSMALAA